MVKRLRRRPLTAESGVRFPMEVPKPSIRAHLALFFRVQTSVIYVIVNSLVFSLESPRSAPFSSVFPHPNTYSALFSYPTFGHLRHCKLPRLPIRKNSLYTLLLGFHVPEDAPCALFSCSNFGHLRHCKLPRFLTRKPAICTLLLGFPAPEYI